MPRRSIPGYGFLAESAHFAEVCRECGLTFIGPGPDVIRRMGDKAEARRTMIEAGVPTVPGSDGVVGDAEAGGGGGRGDRLPGADQGLGRRRRPRHAASRTTPRELERQFEAARNEAGAAFGVPDVYIEKFVVDPRHVEFQVIGDTHGNLVHLFERECSIQRRHQKLLEECPSTALDDELRAADGRSRRCRRGRGPWATSTPARSSSCSTPAASSTSSR